MADDIDRRHAVGNLSPHLLNDSAPSARDFGIAARSAPLRLAALRLGRLNMLIHNGHSLIAGRIVDRHGYSGKSGGADASQHSVCMGLKSIELSLRRVKLAHQFGSSIEVDKVTFSDLARLAGNHTHSSRSFFLALLRHRFDPSS